MVDLVSQWWCAIFNAIALVYCFFLMEETNYDRKHLDHPDPTSSSNSSNNNRPKPLGDITPSTPDQDMPAPPAHPAEKAADGDGKTALATGGSETGETDWPRKSYWDKLSLRDTPRPNRVWDVARAPFRGFLYPSVVYAGLMYGANSLVWAGTQNATAGTVYTTLYGWNTAQVSGAYAGGVLGTMLGGYYAGKVGRVLTVRLARRHDGLSEPEHLLWLFVASMVLVPFALLLYGLGVTAHVHWFGLVFSQFLLAMSNGLCVSAALNYAISSYRELAGGMVVTCVLIRNTLSFAVNYAIGPWLAALGYRNTYLSVAVIGFVWNASLFVLVKWGRRLREATAARYWSDVERARARHA